MLTTSGLEDLFDVDPAEQVLVPDCLQEFGMVSAHVLPDRDDHQFVSVAVSHEPAFAADDSGHFVLLTWCTPTALSQCWHDVGVADRDEDSALRAARDRVARPTPRHPSRWAPERSPVRLPRHHTRPAPQSRGRAPGPLAGRTWACIRPQLPHPQAAQGPG